jgi:hypothetical protein
VITPITVMDVTQITAFLTTKHRQRFEDDPRKASPYKDTKIILLRGPKKPTPEAWKADVEQVDQPVLKEWKSAGAILTRIKNGAAQFFGGEVPEMGRAYIETLKPGGKIDWHVEDGDYAAAHVRLRLCLVPNPAAHLFCGLTSRCLPWGELVRVEHRVLHSAVNLGNWATVNLVVDVRRGDT